MIESIIESITCNFTISQVPVGNNKNRKLWQILALLQSVG